MNKIQWLIKKNEHLAGFVFVFLKRDWFNELRVGGTCKYYLLDFSLATKTEVWIQFHCWNELH